MRMRILRPEHVPDPVHTHITPNSIQYPTPVWNIRGGGCHCNYSIPVDWCCCLQCSEWCDLLSKIH